MSEGFTLLWSKILDSSVWQLDGPTRLVWITLLAMKNKYGVVRTRSAEALAWRARVSPEECRKALKIFSSPDPSSGNQSNQGRRIEEVDDGWLVLNHESYRYSSDARRALWREIKAVERAAKADKAENPVVVNREDLIRQHDANSKMDAASSRAHQKKADELRARQKHEGTVTHAMAKRNNS